MLRRPDLTPSRSAPRYEQDERAAIRRCPPAPSHCAETRNGRHGYRLHHHCLRVLPAHLGLRAPVREGLAVALLLFLGGALAALLLVYLGFVLLFPEKLS